MEEIFVSLDLEMTTARPENQEILEIAAVKFKGNAVIDSWSTLVNPHCAIPYNIQILTGIKQEDVNRAPSLSEVAGPFLKFVKNFPLVAHTVSSDVNCLARKSIHLDNLQLDTYELATILLTHLPAYSLEAVANYLGIKPRASHRAADDALTQKAVFNALWQKIEEIDLSILQEINKLVAPTDWPLREIFQEIEKRKSRSAFNGASIRQQLAAKGGLEFAALDFGFLATEPDQPLTPKPRPQPIDKAALSNLFAPGALFALKFEDYEQRPQQVAMMEMVADAFNNGENLIVEAGTGTGKSMAYLLPAIYFAAQNGQRIIVSTNTINLQDQLFNKDIPKLKEILPVEFKAALVKGRSNYLCLSRWSALQHQHEMTREEIMALVKILIWLPTTESGDVAELSRLSNEDMGVWHRLSAANEGCTGNQCRYFRKGSCFLYRARRKAESSHIVVVNHALLLSNVGTEGVLPESRYLIIDEGHHLEDEATEQLGFSVKESEIRGLLDELARRVADDKVIGLLPEIKNHLRGSDVAAPVQKDLESLAAEMVAQVDEARGGVISFFDRLADFIAGNARDNRGYETRLLLTTAIRTQPAWSDIEVTFETMAARTRTVSNGLEKLLTIMTELEDYKVLDYDALMADLARQTSFFGTMVNQAQLIICDPQADAIYWLATGQRLEDTSLHSAPLHVGEMLQTQLYSTKDAVVVTSATLSTERRFDYIKERLGFDDASELLVESPFDYARSTAVFLPTDMPEPDRPYYQKHLQQAILDIASATGGRTLVLFTSHNQLRVTWQAIHQPLADRGILALGHRIDGMPRRQLLQTFKTNPKTVLLGAASFWEGIDVVGDALSVLIIARLPFAVPTDPVFAARSAQFQDPFHQFSLPQTILRFKQGFGRLIRSQNDRGVVVVLDSRILTKSYGRAFIGSLPNCTFKRMPLQQAASETMDWIKANAHHTRPPQ